MTLNNQSFGHLWYLFTMIGIYLSLPILKTIVDNVPKKNPCLFHWCSVFIELCDSIRKSDYSSVRGIHNSTWNKYRLFLLIGYYISNIEYSKIKSFKLVGLLGLIFSLVMIVLFNKFLGTANEVMLYASPINVVVTVSVYVLVSGLLKGNCTPTLWSVDRLCFGVYLIHPLFIQFAYKFLRITPVSFKAWIPMIFVFSVVFVVVTFIASWVMSMIKPLKKYVV